MAERVLVVDDNDSVRRFLCRVLEEMGIETVEAGSIEEALHVPGPFDLMIVDIHLPDGEGWRIIDNYADIPAIAITGDSDLARSEDIEPERRPILKPIQIRDLNEMVTERLAT